MSFVIIIPAYKPTAALPQLISELRGLTGAPIVVIDDGGGPEHAAIFAACLSVPGLTLLRNAVNLGKGAALKHGLNHALLAHPEAVAFVTADADGQHRPADILAIGAAAVPDALVLGPRSFSSDVPLRSRVGTLVSRHVYRVVAGIRIADTQTGLRAIPRRLAELSLAIRANRYEFETEQLIVARRGGFAFREVPIETVYVDDNRGSHFNPLRDSVRIYFALLRSAAASIATTLLDLTVFVTLLEAGTGILVANLGSRTAAILLQFYLVKNFVFRVEGGIVRFALFAVYVWLMGVISATLQVGLADTLGVGPLAAKIAVDAVLFVFNFIFLREVLFAQPPRR